MLDRPNPIGGRTEGLLLDESRFSSFVGEYAIPTRYGLTVGEYAAFANAEKHIGCELHIPTCEGWARDMYGDETDLLWVNPSPTFLPFPLASTISGAVFTRRPTFRRGVAPRGRLIGSGRRSWMRRSCGGA